MKKIISIILVMLFLLTQTLSCFAAITGVQCNVISNINGATTVKASVTSDVYSDLEDGKASVTYSVYRDGNPLCGFIFPTTAVGSISSVSDGVYKRDYEFITSEYTYRHDSGLYSTVVKATYENTNKYSNETDLFSVPVNGITLNNLSLVMQTGETEQLLSNTIINGEVSDVAVWSTNHPEMVSVSNQGLVNAKAPGTAVVRATSVVNSVYYADCIVTVVDKKTYVDDIEWTKNLNLSRDSLNSVTYGNGVYVAVGGDGTIKTSADANVWINQVSGTLEKLNKVIWNGNIFVVVGDKGIILSSTDGINWVMRLGPVFDDLKDIVWNGNKFVAIGGNYVFTSSDGVKWKPEVESFPNFGLSTIVWHVNQFVACGAYGEVYTSLDGVTWELKLNDMLPEVNNGPSSLASNGKIIVAICNDGKLLTSTDLTTWSDNTPSDCNLSNVIWDGKYFLATGEGGNVIESIDGISWVMKRTPSYSYLSTLTYGGNKYVGVGEGGAIVTSTDRNEWNIIFSGSLQMLTNVVRCGNKYYALSHSGILSSFDGVNWEKKFSDSYGINDMVWTGEIFVAVNEVGKVITSTDGEKWIVRDTGVTYDLKAIAWNGKMFVSVSKGGAVLTSNDGISWIQGKADIWNIGDVIWAGDKFVICGGAGYSNNNILISYDGLTWISVLNTDLSGLILRELCYNGKQIVAYGIGIKIQGSDIQNINIIAYSDDGVNWTLSYDYCPSSVNNIIWDGKEFLAVCYDGNMFKSSDGIAWAWVRTMPNSTSNTLYGVAYNGSSFIAVGENDTILIGSPYIKIEKLTVNKTNISLNLNQTEQLFATIVPDNASNKDVTWSSSNPSVATVSGDGLVTAVGYGSAVIKASSKEDKTFYSECNVEVYGSSGSSSNVPTGYNSNTDNSLPVIKSDGSTVNIEGLVPTLDSGTKNAIVSIGTDTFNIALNQAVENEKGIKQITIEIPKADGAKSYETILPVGILASFEVKNTFEIKTEFGSMLIPSNMINSSDVGNAANVSLVVSKSDTAQLSEGIKTAIGDHPVIELNLVADGKVISWNNTETSVLVRIPYTPTTAEIENNEYIVVWYIDGNGNAIPVPNGRYDKNTGCVSFTTSHFSKYAVSYVHKTFEDMENYDWAQNQIEVLASKDVIKGISDKEYNPSSNITRADFLLLLVKTLGINASSDSNFSDVDKADYYYDAVGIGKKLGIIDGVGDNKFNPNESISRQDMMTMCVRALNLSGKIDSTEKTSGLEEYTDKSLIASYAVDSIAMLVSQELVQGNGQSLNPLGNSTRAEVAVLMYRIYSKYVTVD